MRDRFYQFSWRPRPPSLLSPEEIKEIARNLRKYSEKYAKEDESLMAQVPPLSFGLCSTPCTLRPAPILPVMRLALEPLWAAAAAIDGQCVLDISPNRTASILRHHSQADAADMQRSPSTPV